MTRQSDTGIDHNDDRNWEQQLDTNGTEERYPRPEEIRQAETELHLTDSTADLLPPELVRWHGYKLGEEGEGDASESGDPWELWPDFVCPACNRGERSVTYEHAPTFETSDLDREELSKQYAWEGRRPVCRRCGSGLFDRHVKQFRPARWKQPLLHAMGLVDGLSNAYEPLFEAYDHNPVGFVRSNAEDLRQVEGIGPAFSRDLVVKKHYLFPGVAPEPNPEWDQTKAHAEWQQLLA